jgi:hypothetical protein
LPSLTERQRHPDAVGDVRAFQDAHVQVVVDVVAGHRDRDDRGPAVEHHEPEAVVGRSGGGGLAKPVAQVLHLGASLQIGVLGQLRETLYGAAEIQDPDHGQVVVLADGPRTEADDDRGAQQQHRGPPEAIQVRQPPPAEHHQGQAQQAQQQQLGLVEAHVHGVSSPAAGSAAAALSTVSSSRPK